MKRRASSVIGAACKLPGAARGFTLLEMCLVLFILALLAAVALPAIQSAFVEDAVRNDSREISLMVRTAMLRSSEQHRPYVMDLTSTNLYLHPVAEPPSVDADAGLPVTSFAQQEAADAKRVEREDVELTTELDPANKLLAPDAEKKNVWDPMPPTTWTFQPGELCPASRVRVVHGDSWVELGFNRLTGNVEDETAYFP